MVIESCIIPSGGFDIITNCFCPSVSVDLEPFSQDFGSYGKENEKSYHINEYGRSVASR